MASLILIFEKQKWDNDVHFRGVFVCRVSEEMLFSPCVFVCLFVCLFVSVYYDVWLFNYEGLVPRNKYFAGTWLAMSSCACYVLRTHDVTDDVSNSQSRSNLKIALFPSIFQLERRSKAQNNGNAHGYLASIFNFRYHFPSVVTSKWQLFWKFWNI